MPKYFAACLFLLSSLTACRTAPPPGPSSPASAPTQEGASSIEAAEAGAASAPGGGEESTASTAPAPPDLTEESESAPVASAPTTPPPGWEPIPERHPKGFPGKPFAQVRAYAFDLENDGRPICPTPINKDGTLCETVEQPGVVLSEEQAGRLLALLQSSGTYGEPSKCFLPHHGFVFYDEAGGPVAYFSVCFLCDNALALPLLPKIKRFDNYYGLSEKGSAELRALCRELGLPKCDARSPSEFFPER